MLDCLLINGVYSHSSGTDFEEYLKREENQSRFLGFFYPYSMFEALNTMTYLEENGLRCDCAISMTANYEKIITNLINGVRVVSIMSYVTNLYDYVNIVKIIRKYSKTTKIVIGGSFFKNLITKLNDLEKRHILRLMDADLYINRYECQTELLNYVKQFKTAGSLSKQVRNSIVIKDGQCQYTPADYSNTYQDQYPIHFENHSDLLSPIVGLRTTINCNFSCAFCAIKDDADRFYMVSIPKIEQDLRSLKRLKKAQTIFFLDETINYPVDRFCDFLNMMIQNQFHLQWFSFFRCQFIDQEIACLARKSGCIASILGIESGDDGMLYRMNKQVNTQQLHAGIQALKKAGIITVALFVIGFPGENEQSIKKTVDFINTSKPDFYVLNSWTCEIGTSIWQEREKFNLVCHNGKWKHNTMSQDDMERIIADMESQILYSTNLRTMDFTNIIEMVNRGYSFSAIKEIIDRYWKTKGK